MPERGQVSALPYWQQQVNALGLAEALLDTANVWVWAWTTAWSSPCHDDWAGHERV